MLKNDSKYLFKSLKVSLEKFNCFWSIFLPSEPKFRMKTSESSSSWPSSWYIPFSLIWSGVKFLAWHLWHRIQFIVVGRNSKNACAVLILLPFWRWFNAGSGLELSHFIFTVIFSLIPYFYNLRMVLESFFSVFCSTETLLKLSEGI